MLTLENPHVVPDDRGTLVIRGTRFKLVMLLREHLAYGWDAPELQVQHPELTLSQIHAGLSYYYDHRDELDAEIRRRDELVERLQAEQGESPIRRKLRESGKLP